MPSYSSPTSGKTWFDIYDSVTYLGTSNDIDCSLENRVFVKTVNGDATLQFINETALPTGCFDIRLLISYNSGNLILPTATLVNETALPTFEGGNVYVIPMFTLNGGTTWYIGGA